MLHVYICINKPPQRMYITTHVNEMIRYKTERKLSIKTKKHVSVSVLYFAEFFSVWNDCLVIHLTGK